MSITFDDGTQRTWSVSRQRVFSLSNNNLVVTITGTHTDGATTGICEWGLNRYGNAFTTAITAPLVLRQDCNYRLTAGSILQSRLGITAAITFGLDANGNATSCPGVLASYYYKLVWTGLNGVSYTFILPY
jgi:hypothetical protein